MSRRLRAIDLFCGAGGASAGLRRAGFSVLGIDIAPQPNYPSHRDRVAFEQRDAFAVTARELSGFDLIWASPPCQGRTAYRRRPGHVRPVDTDGGIAKIRALLRASRRPYIIENVPGAPLLSPTVLCGSMFAELRWIRRHRCFETSWNMFQPPCMHHLANGDFPQATNRAARRKTCEIGVWRIPLATQQLAMGGVDWMTREELSQSIPPAYAQWLGEMARR